MKTGFPYIPIVAKNIKKNMLLELMDKNIFKVITLKECVLELWGFLLFWKSSLSQLQLLQELFS